MEMAMLTHPPLSLVTSTLFVTADIIMTPRRAGIISTPGIMIPRSKGLSTQMGLSGLMEFLQAIICLRIATTIRL